MKRLLIYAAAAFAVFSCTYGGNSGEKASESTTGNAIATDTKQTNGSSKNGSVSNESSMGAASNGMHNTGSNASNGGGTATNN